jgi:predicted MFS family arabinose efflux permease
LSDRLPAPHILLALSLTAAGGLALPLLSWSPAIALSILMGFAYSLVNATGRPAVLTLLSRVSNDARGAVMGLNITFSSFGWIGATALGGYVVGQAGFGGLGVLTLGFGLVGSVLALGAWLAPHAETRLVAASTEN